MSVRLILVCDRCGDTHDRGGRNATVARDNARSAGWTYRIRYRAGRDYCPRCSESIELRAEARQHRGPKGGSRP